VPSFLLGLVVMRAAELVLELPPLEPWLYGFTDPDEPAALAGVVGVLLLLPHPAAINAMTSGEARTSLLAGKISSPRSRDVLLLGRARTTFPSRTAAWCATA
jgi:hypothetical protein